MFLLHTYHNITFSLFCCQGDAKISAQSKQPNNQEERLTQPSGESSKPLLMQTLLFGTCARGRVPLSVLRYQRVTAETEKGNLTAYSKGQVKKSFFFPWLWLLHILSLDCSNLKLFVKKYKTLMDVTSLLLSENKWNLVRNRMKLRKNSTKAHRTDAGTKNQLFGQPFCKICPDDNTLPKPITVSYTSPLV